MMYIELSGVTNVSQLLYSDQVMSESVDELTWIGIKVIGRTINNLRYAVDIVLIATSPAALQQLIGKENAVSREYGF